MLQRLQQLLYRWNRDDAGLMSAAVAYYAVLSMFPLLLILTSGLGVFLEWTNAGHDAEHYIMEAIGDQLSPALAQHIVVALDQVKHQASFNGPLGFATLLIAAMAMFAQFERAFDRIWGIESPKSLTFLQTAVRVVTHRLRAFVMLLGVGVAIVVFFFAGVGFQAFQAFAHESISGVVWLWWMIETLLIMFLNACVFAMLYRFLPKARVQWIHAFRGGVFAAICWEIGRQVLASFVIGQHYSIAYGLIGSLLAIMLWAYYSFSAIFLGAEYAQLLGEESGFSGQPAPVADGPAFAYTAEATVGTLLFYVATFLAVRQFAAHELPDLHPNESVVVFSRTADGQQWCKLIFAPLIATLPGSFHYPDGVEIPEVLKHLEPDSPSPIT